MGSKLIAKTILICSICILLILGIILVMNQTGLVKSGQESAITDTQAANMSSKDYVSKNGTNVALNGNTRAFMSDESFWDAPEAGEGLSDIIDTTNVNDELVVVSLQAVSVDHDLRFQILNPQGNRIEGVSFYVTLENVGQFKDLDQDGVIYIGDLEPGDYVASVDPQEGYLVAASKLNVHVKDKLEYRAISDIALLFKTEAQIDPGEIVPVMPATDSDADATEKTTLFKDLERAQNGIDISSENGEINWMKVDGNDLSFAMIRCGYRSSQTGSLVCDESFLSNVEGAKSIGLKTGVYFCSQAITEKEAVEEASLVINLLRSLDVELPVYMSCFELSGDGRADHLTKDERTQICIAFCKTMKNSGYRCGVQASSSFMLNKVDRTQVGKYLTWIKEYRGNTTYPGAYQMWQYTASGYIDGIVGAVDLDIANLDGTYIDEYRSMELDESEMVTSTSADEDADDSEDGPDYTDNSGDGSSQQAQSDDAGGLPVGNTNNDDAGDSPAGNTNNDKAGWG